MKFPRRRFLQLAAGVAVLPIASRIAGAQAYPTRPIRVVVGYAPAGGTDIFVRLIGQPLSDRLGQSLVIENRPGAASNIATDAVVHAPADGYTLLGFDAAAAINATLYEKLNFNFIRDIATIGIIRGPLLLIVHPVRSRPFGSRIHRLRQGQSGQDQHGVGRHRKCDPYGRRVVQGDDPHRDDAHTLSRRRACRDRPARGPGAGLFRQHAADDRAYPGRQAARCWR